MSVAPQNDNAIAASWCEIAQRLGPMVDVFNELRLGVSVDDACRALRRPSRVALNRELKARQLDSTRFRGRLTRPNLGAEAAHGIEQEGGAV